MLSGDPINRIGYKNGVIIGLLICGRRQRPFYPAAVLVSYPFFLVGLFIVGLGFAMLQIAANPYVTILGPERTASSRLNLSQAFNSFGTTIGPIIGGWLIFTFFTSPGRTARTRSRFRISASRSSSCCWRCLFKFAHLPNFTNAERSGRGLGALKHPHTVLGMLAIFMYVGGEVTVGSTIVNFLGTPRLGGMPHETASGFLAFYWGGLMIGRFMGAFALSDLRGWLKKSLIVAGAGGGVRVIIMVSGLSHAPASPAPLALGERISAIVADGLPNALALRSVSDDSAGRCSFLARPVLSGCWRCSARVIIALLATGVLTAGDTAQWTILAVGLFCSVMWSNIFSLAIEGLGPLKSQGSSLLVMAILGGAILPPLQGAVADHFGIQYSFVVPMVAFAFIAFYGLYGYRAGRQLTKDASPAERV